MKPNLLPPGLSQDAFDVYRDEWKQNIIAEGGNPLDHAAPQPAEAAQMLGRKTVVLKKRIQHIHKTFEIKRPA